MKKSLVKNHTFWFTIINAFLFVSTVIVTYITLSFGTVAGQVDTATSNSLFYIVTFTVLSNIFLGLVGLVGVYFGVKSLKKSQTIPRQYLTWYLVATAAGMLTVITVITFLAPLRAMRGRNYFEMMMGPMFFFHFFNPLLASYALIYLTPKERLTRKDCLFAMLPTAFYAIPYVLNVVILHTWYDFYNFTFGGNNWAIIPVFIVISLIIFGIASLLAFLHNKKSTSTSPHLKSVV